MDINNSQTGFTLIEGLIVVAILGIIATFAISNWSQLITQKRVRASMESLYDSLKLARSESLKQQTDITIKCIVNSCSIDDTEISKFQSGLYFGKDNDDNTITSQSITFEGTRGTASKSLKLTFTDSSYSGTVSINAMGSINNCSDTVTGYPKC